MLLAQMILEPDRMTEADLQYLKQCQRYLEACIRNFPETSTEIPEGSEKSAIQLLAEIEEAIKLREELADGSYRSR